MAELQVLTPAANNYKAGDASLTIIFPSWNETYINLLQADNQFCWRNQCKYFTGR